VWVRIRHIFHVQLVTFDITASHPDRSYSFKTAREGRCQDLYYIPISSLHRFTEDYPKDYLKHDIGPLHTSSIEIIRGQHLYRCGFEFDISSTSKIVTVDITASQPAGLHSFRTASEEGCQDSYHIPISSLHRFTEDYLKDLPQARHRPPPHLKHRNYSRTASLPMWVRIRHILHGQLSHSTSLHLNRPGYIHSGLREKKGARICITSPSHPRIASLSRVNCDTSISGDKTRILSLSRVNCDTSISDTYSLSLA
jgi:hypothetical protein